MAGGRSRRAEPCARAMRMAICRMRDGLLDWNDTNLIRVMAERPGP